MKDNIFVNQAFNDAILSYMNYKQTTDNEAFFSFPVMVIRSLIAIYGELDIINPYRTKNEDRMGGLDENLTKFGFPKTSLNKLKESFEKYTQAKKEQVFPNPYFIIIEKYLIDMFYYRKKSVNIKEEEIQNFQNLLYLSNTNNRVMREEINNSTDKIEVIDHYWNSKLYESSHKLQFMPYKKNTLLPEAYNVLGYTLESIASMDEKTLGELNLKILSFFKIDPEEPNKRERLKQAVTYYKQFGNRITTGNGYVDMLMLLSIIATVMMTLFVVTVKVLGG